MSNNKQRIVEVNLNGSWWRKSGRPHLMKVNMDFTFIYLMDILLRILRRQKLY